MRFVFFSLIVQVQCHIQCELFFPLFWCIPWLVTSEYVSHIKNHLHKYLNPGPLRRVQIELWMSSVRIMLLGNNHDDCDCDITAWRTALDLSLSHSLSLVGSPDAPLAGQVLKVDLRKRGIYFSTSYSSSSFTTVVRQSQTSARVTEIRNHSL